MSWRFGPLLELVFEGRRHARLSLFRGNECGRRLHRQDQRCARSLREIESQPQIA